jgi:hypothetical protein
MLNLVYFCYFYIQYQKKLNVLVDKLIMKIQYNSIFKLTIKATEID